MDFYDKVEIVDGARITKDGYLVARARIARTGVYDYAGHEVGRPDIPQVKIYRPDTEVFHPDALASFAYKPLTNDHPPEAVTAQNWLKHATGFLGGEVAQDGIYVNVPLTMMDQVAISDFNSGKRELSAGYHCDLQWTPGVTPKGEKYDAIQTNIRANHLALVGAGRAGSQCRVGDEAPEETDDMADGKPLRVIVVDGLSVETTDQGAQAVDKLQRELADARAALTKVQTDHTAAIAAKDAELGKKDGEITDLKKKQVTDQQLETLAADRAAVIGKAKAIAPELDCSGKSLVDIRRLAVGVKLGDEKVKDKSPDYVEALFDSLAATASKDTSRSGDPFRDTIRNADTRQQGDHLAAYDDMCKGLESAWRGDQSKETH